MMVSGLWAMELYFCQSGVNNSARMINVQDQLHGQDRFNLQVERLGPLPLVNLFIERIGLEDMLDRHVKSDARCAVPHARALGVVLRSLIVEREPIYRQQETVHGFASGMFGLSAKETLGRRPARARAGPAL